MKISVALATYNGSRYLREQLASLSGQTLLPDELVVSDDGSTDDTLEIVRAFAITAPFPVRILSKSTRLGFSDNFLHAAEACQHEVIALCDQDDVWLPTKLEIEAARLHADHSLIVLHTLTVTDELLKPTGLHWTQDIEKDEVYEPLQLDPYCVGWGNTMMFRRELVHLIDRQLRPRQPEFPDRPLSHDTWIYTLAAALGRVSHITRPLILYRQHGSNAAGFIGWRPRTKLE
ncbi:MAG: glycosyltransferase family 2 protein, partial [Oxalobacteraceae bacterium]